MTIIIEKDADLLDATFTSLLLRSIHLFPSLFLGHLSQWRTAQKMCLTSRAYPHSLSRCLTSIGRRQTTPVARPQDILYHDAAQLCIFSLCRMVISCICPQTVWTPLIQLTGTMSKCRSALPISDIVVRKSVELLPK